MGSKSGSKAAAGLAAALAFVILIGMGPRVRAEAVTLELVGARDDRAVSTPWVTLAGDWFGPAKAGPGEWYWIGESRAITGDANTEHFEIVAKRPIGGAFTLELDELDQSLASGPSLGGSGADMTGSGSSGTGGVSQTSSDTFGGADLGFSGGSVGTVSGGAAEAPAYLAAAEEGSGTAPTSAPALITTNETTAPNDAVPTPLPSAAVSGMAALSGFGLFGRRRKAG